MCIGGGVGLNALANGKILSKTPFERIHIFGPAGDSGGAIGTALYTYYKHVPSGSRSYIQSLALGNRYELKEIKNLLTSSDKSTYDLKIFESSKVRNVFIADLLKKGFVGGLFEGKMEFGPRALGSRSIIASPHSIGVKNKVNIIKKREEFRPFGLSVLEENMHNIFEIPIEITEAPYMNMCFIVRKEWSKLIPAVVHVDNTTRIQSVSKKKNQKYYTLISMFYKKTGIPGLLNTSLNIKGEPLIESPAQALSFFLKQPIDFLVLENHILLKK